MSLSRGVFAGTKPADEVFIGWDKAPVRDRRFLLLSLPLLGLGAAGAARALAQATNDPGAGLWDTGHVTRVTGALRAAPYPMLYVEDAASPYGVRTILLVALGKCTSALKLATAEDQVVTASGVLIERGARRMLEVPLALDKWLEASSATVKLPPLQPESLGRAKLSGQIMDTKCFFGVMRPSLGKTHKACASLCIRGGIPPSFWARRKDGKESILLMTDAAGKAHGEAILPFVGEPVAAEGEIVRVGDLLQFRADAAAFAHTG